MPTSQNVETIKMLDNALAVLDTLRVGNSSEGTVRLGVNEIAKQCDISPSTAFRILKTLEVNGWVYQCHDDKYILGEKLGFALSSNNLYIALKEVAGLVMSKYAVEVGQGMNLMIREGTQCYILQQARSNSLINYMANLYSSLPYYASACGKILLSELPIALVDELIHSEKMEKFTPNTIATPEEFWEQLRQVAKLGYAFDNKESSRDGSCVAVPVRDKNGRIIAGISFSGFLNISDINQLVEYVPILNKASAEITEKLFKIWDR